VDRSAVEKTGQELFDFATNREDVKWLMAHLAPEAKLRCETVEYELQILKIISVGWSISYYLAEHELNQPLSQWYWAAIQEFSNNLSTTTELMIGKNINYFEVLKSRLDMYVNAMAHTPAGSDATQVIGSRFAETCGDANNIFAFMTGSKLFINVTGHISAYIDAIVHAPADPSKLH